MDLDSVGLDDWRVIGLIGMGFRALEAKIELAGGACPVRGVEAAVPY